ncbi:hypothetical protein AGRA3207_007500 [Actinomadura graeca]|uniref:Uncharacterized protein n=1 Tax=Actinomadura graeca TaxID=2750812 RepID=A0ABX8R5X3_9ACTN|nr:hypothetical protein [Actinomadura graeca]QXJ25931.1 hypothetical protein AGRA3207_007500 [Actinomadura graeca]
MIKLRTLHPMIVISDDGLLRQQMAEYARCAGRSCLLTKSAEGLTAALDNPVLLVIGEDMAGSLADHTSSYVPGWDGGLLPLRIGRFALLTRTGGPYPGALLAMQDKLHIGRVLGVPLSEDDRAWLADTLQTVGGTGP